MAPLYGIFGVLRVYPRSWNQFMLTNFMSLIMRMEDAKLLWQSAIHATLLVY